MCSYAYTDTDTHLQPIDNHSHPSCQSQRGWPGRVDPVPAQGQSITCPHNPRPPALLGLGPLLIPSLPSPLLSLLPNFPSAYKTHSHLSHPKSTLVGRSPRAACPVRVTTFRFSFTHLCTVQLDVDNFCNLNCPYPPPPAPPANVQTERFTTWVLFFKEPLLTRAGQLSIPQALVYV